MPIIIVGAGMAGLACATYLCRAGRDVVLLDADSAPGGRVQTDVVDGFRLDRGFQILLTAYPEAQRIFDYNALDLRYFRSGALIRHDGDWLKLLNPLREPAGAFTTLSSPFGTFGDKLRVLGLLGHVKSLSVDDLFAQDAKTTLAFLREWGFSEEIITRFFRPFFGGVFLEDELATSSNFFEFCFRMFFLGDAAVPARGIGELANQLARQLPAGTLRLDTPVERIEGQTVHLAGGETLRAEAVVLAVDRAAAARLLGQPAPPETAFNHTTCTYFAAPQSPKPERLLMLNPNRTGAVHNVAVMTDVAPSYSTTGEALISVSTQVRNVVDEEKLTAQLRPELIGWFGDAVAGWRHLKTYHLPQALPTYGPNARHAPLQVGPALFQCGDHTAYPSLNAALQTGRLVAEFFK